MKVKFRVLLQRYLHGVKLVTSSALPSRKWQLIGVRYCGALCGHPKPAIANNWIRTSAQQIYHRSA